MVNLINKGRYKVNKKTILTKLDSILSEQKIGDEYDFTIILVGRRKMKYITEKYKKENETLPVLSFSYPEKIDDSLKDESITRGEIFICYPLAVLLAAEKDTTVDKMLLELSVHGLRNILSEN